MSKIMQDNPEAACEHWNLPDLGDPSAKACGYSRASTADGNKPYENGFEQGRLEGIEAGRHEVLTQVQVLQQLMRGLARPFEELDREVEQELVALTFAIVRKLVHVEIKTSPEQIATIVNEAVALLPGSARDIQLHLHPEDARLLNDLSPAGAGDGLWKVTEDVSLIRGDCIVKTRTSQIDATVEARLENIIASLLQIDSSEEETS